jgi:hypothetical protein
VQLHDLGLLKQVVVLDTAAANRGVLSIGTFDAGQIAGKLLFCRVYVGHGVCLCRGMPSGRLVW